MAFKQTLVAAIFLSISALGETTIPIEMPSDKEISNAFKIIEEFSTTAPSNIDHFDFEGTSSLEDARIVLFSEFHNHYETLLNNYKLLDRIAKPGDTLLLEGYSFSEQVDCAAYILQHLVKSSGYNWNPLFFVTMRRAPLPGVTCRGWDDHLRENLTPRLRAQLLPDEVSTTAQLALLFTSLYTITESGFSINNEALIGRRNKGLIAAISRLESEPYRGRIFVISGADHLPSTFSSVSLGQDSGVLDETREFLAQRKHALVVSKGLHAAVYEAEMHSRIWLQNSVSALIFALVPYAVFHQWRDFSNPYFQDLKYNLRALGVAYALIALPILAGEIAASIRR